MTLTPPEQAAPAYPGLRIEDHVGVCGVRDDTTALAEAAAALGAPGSALDMGTGSGFVALYLAQRGWQVDATDVSQRALDLARRNAARNGLDVRFYPSDLFAQVTGKYDVIAFNPPMRPDENEFSRLVTSVLRRSPRLSRLLMRTVGHFFEQGRHVFLAHVLAEARGRLNPGGSVLMGISQEEARDLDALPGVRLVRMTPIPSMERQEVCQFQFDEGTGL
jgi:methylase of polypeptide subunit release factors